MYRCFYSAVSPEMSTNFYSFTNNSKTAGHRKLKFSRSVGIQPTIANGVPNFGKPGHMTKVLWLHNNKTAKKFFKGLQFDSALPSCYFLGWRSC